MPRQAKPTAPTLPEQTLVIDNGAYTIKAGWASPTPDPSNDCHVIPNAMARGRDRRVWIGGQLDKCPDFGEMAFRRPIEKGHLVNWEAEKEIWDQSFFDKDARLKCDPHETNLILTEAPNAPSILQTNSDQMIFEEYEFASYSRCLGPSLNAYNDIPAMHGKPPRSADASSSKLPVEAMIVVDSGFSHTTITPVLRGQPLHASIRRLDIGGKLLTNYLKELVSVRHYNMMDETHLMNQVKEAVCYVSLNFGRDLERTWKGRSSNESASDLVVDYVLPDYNTHKRGFKRAHDPALAHKTRKLQGALGGADGAGAAEDYMTLANERFAVPELLFSPTDVGMKQAGLPGLVMQSLQTLPGGLWPALLANVVIVGGNAQMPGLVARLQTELRQLAPAECVVRVVRAPDPVRSTWLGGAHLANDREALRARAVTREEYQEHGAAWVARKFSAPIVTSAAASQA